MPQTTVTNRFIFTGLQPAIRPDEAIELAVNLTPSTTFPQGAVLGRIGTAAVNDVQTIADTGTVSGGTFTVTVTDPVTGQTSTTAAVAYNVTNADLKTALQAVLSGSVVATVAGSGLPTNDTTVTFSGSAAGLPVPVMTINSASLTGGGSLGVTHTTVGHPAEVYGLYSDANSDGTETAKCILRYSCITDASGRITVGGAQVGGGYVHGETYDCVPAYFAGYFFEDQISGLDANGLADLGKRIAPGLIVIGV